MRLECKPSVARMQIVVGFARQADTSQLCPPSQPLHRDMPALQYQTWKGDMDGYIDCSNKDIKKEIDNLFSGDVF